MNLPPPRLIGATGGSGTRAFARAARRAGLFTGADLNVSEDSLPFGAYSDRWIDAYLPFRRAGTAPDPDLEARMRADLERTLAAHLDGWDGTAPWGWKEPRSAFLLPFFAGVFPGLRFVHVVRDGRDMAFSTNQNQLRKHGAAWRIGERGSRQVRSIRLWSALNTATAAYGREVLGDRYLRLRFEDLCARPAATIAELLRFAGLDGDPEELARDVEAPSGLGRWRGERRRVVAALEREAGEALRLFGYVP